MVSKYQLVKANIGVFLIVAILALSFVSVFAADVQNTPSTRVVVGNASPTVASVVLNGGSAIVLTANVTTSFNISYQISDANGCADINTNTAGTSTAYRSGVSATCAIESPTTSSLSCYSYITRVTSSCSGTTINVTDTVDIFYFAESTDATGEFPSQTWAATAFARDLAAATGSAASASIELNTLVGIRITTTTINYNNGTAMSASSTTGTTDNTTPYHTATTTNVGNVSTTYSIRTSGTLTSGANSVATSNQRWATSTYNYDTESPSANGPTSTQLTGSNVNVTDHILIHATTTAGPGASSTRRTFWGLKVPAGSVNATYTGTNVYTGAIAP